jgi:site-specific DNA-methyltransferase (adenine-specific)
MGTGAINVDGGRVDGGTRPLIQNAGRADPRGEGFKGKFGSSCEGSTTQGRFPANLIHDGSDEVVGLFPMTTSGKPGNSVRNSKGFSGIGDSGLDESIPLTGFGDSGSAARFFYCAKASKRDRDGGLEGFALVKSGVGDARQSGDFGERLGPRADGSERKQVFGRNHHPTVKPTALMRYLCRLITPPGGTVLDPFMGSGSTGKAAMLEGFRFVGIEREPEYLEIAAARIRHALTETQTDLLREAE